MAMPKKRRSKDSKDFATKQTLNPPAGREPRPGGAAAVPNPAGPGGQPDSDQRIGQFTGRGAPGLQKK
jgi:hypothetical protein